MSLLPCSVCKNKTEGIFFCDNYFMCPYVAYIGNTKAPLTSVQLEAIRERRDASLETPLKPSFSSGNSGLRQG